MKTIATFKTRQEAETLIAREGHTPGQWVAGEHWNGKVTVSVETVWDIEPDDDGRFAVVVESRLRHHDEEGRCEWFAGCLRPAAGTVPHPILRQVPTCRACAEAFDLDLTPTA